MSRMLKMPFAKVPYVAALDSRLTLRQLRVLIAILSFATTGGDTVFPTRDALSRRCGLPDYRISTTTTELASLGWLEKIGKGGFSKATRYRITVPADLEKLMVSEYGETVSESDTVNASQTVSELDTVEKPETVSKSATVAESDTGERTTVSKSATVANSATVAKSDTRMPVSNSDTRKEETKEETSSSARRSRNPPIQKPESVAQQTWDDWLALRKQKRAPVTPTVLRQAQREAEKAGWSLEDFLAEWCARGSQGLKAAWLLERAATPSAAGAMGGFV